MATMGKYCKAYWLHNLREFNQWSEDIKNKTKENKNVDGKEVEVVRELTDARIVYLQQNYAVTDAIFPDENIIFERVTPEWIDFCHTTLGVEIPVDKPVDVRVSSVALAPIAREGQIPLSFAQQRLWFRNQLEPESAVDNISGAVRLQGELNVAVLQQSLNEIIRRHEVLRTNFTTKDGQPVAIIHAALALTLLVVDLRSLPAMAREITSQQLATQQAQRPFNLADAPLIRASLLQLSQTEHILLFTMHQIVADDWSMSVLVRELATIYQAFFCGQPSPLQALPIQYADFALWQQKWLQGEVLQPQLAYWQQQLKGAPPLLSLPTDRPRPAVQTFRGAHQSIAVSQQLSEALTILSRQEGVTLFMTLLAAFATLLYRYTATPDILVGTPIANRNREELEGLIGFFTNTLVLRTDLSNNPSFQELLGKVRQVALDAYANQDLPFEMLLETLQPERNVSHTPLFQVMFVLQNAPLTAMELPGLTVSSLPVTSNTAKFDLTLSLEHTQQGLIGFVEYNTELFDASTIARMVEHFQTLLSGIVSNPRQRIGELPLLTAAEQQQLLVEWNDTWADYPLDKCIHQLFELQAERTPNAVAVVFEDQFLTYNELNCRANQLSHYLQQLGVEPEVLVGICVERSLEMVVGLLGILKAGGAYVPLDPAYPQERLVLMLSDARVQVLLTTEKLVTKLPEHRTSLVCLDTDWKVISRHSEDNPVSGAQPTSLAYVLYTSGSTGRPKGVAIEHHSPVALLSWARAVFTTEQLAGVLASTSICFDLSVFELFTPLICGGKVILVENVLSLPSLRAVQDVTLINTVPSAIAELLRVDGILSSAHTINLAGEPLQNSLVQRLYQQDTIEQVFNLYGPSEDTTYSTFALVKKGSSNSPNIGRPIANTQVYILDQHLQPVPIGVIGELHISGAGLARGYLNRSELTAAAFIPNLFSPQQGARLYKTGDLARYLPDGNIEYLGRCDHQVKLRGFRIELAEIEAALSQHPAVAQTAVIVREDQPGNKRLVAYLVLEQEQAPTIIDLRRFLAQQLPEYMVPNAFVILDIMPLTPNGKVDRRTLPVPDTNSLAPDASFVPPRDIVEQQLASIWTDLLNLNGIGIRDSFFNLGGHSLLAVSLMARIQQHFGKKLPLTTLFHHSTIEQLATVVRQSTDALPQSCLVPIHAGGSRRPFFCVPGAGGSVFYLRDLALSLGSDQPFYGLQARGLDGESEPHTRFEDMAADYIAAIQTIQPQGPYLLGGHSFGGLVAFEMAQQLQQQGHEVALLAIINMEGSAINNFLGDIEWDDAKYILLFAAIAKRYYGKNLEVSEATLQTLTPDEQLHHFLELLKKVNMIPPNAEFTQFRGYMQVFKAQVQMNYLPQEVYPIPITFFRANEIVPELNLSPEVLEDPTLGWGKVSAQPVEVHIVPGNHVTMMTPTHVQVLAAQLLTCLERAQANACKTLSGSTVLST